MPALNVAVRDVLPARRDVRLRRRTRPRGPARSPAVTRPASSNCTGGTIERRRGRATITIQATAPQPDRRRPHQPGARGSGQHRSPRATRLNNTRPSSTTVTSDINLTIDEDGPDTSSQSQVTDYKITVTNQSPGERRGQRGRPLRRGRARSAAGGLDPPRRRTRAATTGPARSSRTRSTSSTASATSIPTRPVTITITRLHDRGDRPLARQRGLRRSRRRHRGVSTPASATTAGRTARSSGRRQAVAGPPGQQERRVRRWHVARARPHVHDHGRPTSATRRPRAPSR